MLNSNSSINSPFEIGTLNKESLYNLLDNALAESIQVDAEIDKIIASQQRIQQLNSEQATRGKINVLILIIGLFFYLVPGIIYLVVKNSIRGKYDALIESELSNLSNLESYINDLYPRCTNLHLIPADYYYPLAINTMMKYLINGQAENWKECSLMYEEQLHRWQLEADSAQSVELQKYTAAMTGAIAINTARTANNTSQIAHNTARIKNNTSISANHDFFD